MKIPNTIQLGEYSTSSGKEGVSYNTDSDGNLNVFNVDHDDDDRWLNTYNGHPDNLYNPDNRVVFVVPRNSQCFSPLHGGEFIYHGVVSTSRRFACRRCGDVQK